MSAHLLFPTTSIKEDIAYLDGDEPLLSITRDTVLAGLSTLHELNADISLFSAEGEILWLDQKERDNLAIENLLLSKISLSIKEQLFVHPIEFQGRFYYFAPVYSQPNTLRLIVILSTSQTNSDILLALLQSLAREASEKLKYQSYLHSSLPKQLDNSCITDLNIQTVEKALIIEVAKNCRGKIQQMHRILNMGRTTLWRKLKQYDINIKEFK